MIKIEKQLNELINKVENDINSLSPERDKKLLNVLMFVSSISQDGEINKLQDLINTNFPEYGK